MKKIGKLSINQSKVLKNEELVNLRGGSGSYRTTRCCECWLGGTIRQVIAGSTSSDCDDDCEAISNGWYVGVWAC